MSDQTTNALLAVALGTVAAIILLVPTAAYQYRLDGRLQPRDLAVLVSAAVYGLALWTYTLLPTPVDHTFACKPSRLNPLTSIREIWGHPAVQQARRHHQQQATDHLHYGAVLQIVLNLLLFLPLGYYVRVIVKRGWVTATIVGLATSALIETTQLTGDWHVYHCAYRSFDVDDLLVNTLGALAGSLLAARYVSIRRGEIPPLPSTITVGRRLVGLTCDAVFVVLAGGGAAALYRGLCLYGPGTFHRPVQTALLVGVPFVVEAATVLAVGRTVGDHAISVRAVARRPRLTPLARLVKLLVGVTPPLVLLAIGGWTAAVGIPVFALVTVVAALTTPGLRGLSHLAAGMDLRIAVEEELDSDHDGLPGVRDPDASAGPGSAPRSGSAPPRW